MVDLRFSNLVQYCPLDFRNAILESRIEALTSHCSDRNKESGSQAKSSLLCWTSLSVSERLFWTVCIQPRNGWWLSEERNCNYCWHHESTTLSRFTPFLGRCTTQNSQNNCWQFRVGHLANGASHSLLLHCRLFWRNSFICDNKTGFSRFYKKIPNKYTLHPLRHNYSSSFRCRVTLPLYYKPTSFSVSAVSERQLSFEGRTGGKCARDSILIWATHRKWLRFNDRKSTGSWRRVRIQTRIGHPSKCNKSYQSVWQGTVT